MSLTDTAFDVAEIAETPPVAQDRKRTAPVLKLVLELGPLLVFFFANTKGAWLAEHVSLLANLGAPIFVGTACFMAATALSLSISWALTRTIPIMPLLSGIVVLSFGAATLWFHDETFIKVKPTVINSMFGGLLLGGLWFNKSLLGYVFDTAFNIDAKGWRILTLRWGLYFLLMAAVNEVLWRNFSTDFWIAFKVWVNLPLAIGFMLLQMPTVKRHALAN